MRFVPDGFPDVWTSTSLLMDKMIRSDLWSERCCPLKSILLPLDHIILTFILFSSVSVLIVDIQDLNLLRFSSIFTISLNYSTFFKVAPTVLTGGAGQQLIVSLNGCEINSYYTFCVTVI